MISTGTTVVAPLLTWEQISLVSLCTGAVTSGSAMTSLRLATVNSQKPGRDNLNGLAVNISSNPVTIAVRTLDQRIIKSGLSILHSPAYLISST